MGVRGWVGGNGVGTEALSQEEGTLERSLPSAGRRQCRLKSHLATVGLFFLEWK